MVYVFFADGFEEIEGITIVDVLRRAQIATQMVGIGARTIRGAHDITVSCDILDTEIDLSAMKMIVLPGGMPGTLNLEKSPIVQAAIEHCAANKLWIAAICAAPSVLGHGRLLDGKRATVFPGFEKEMGDAILSDDAVVKDGSFITGNGPGAALNFALTLVEVLSGKTEAKGISDSMQWKDWL